MSTITVTILLIVMWCVLILADGINAGLQFSNGNTGLGIMWATISLLWSAAIVLKVLQVSGVLA